MEIRPQLTLNADELCGIASDFDRTVHYLVHFLDKFASGKSTSFRGDERRETLRSCLADLTDLRRRLNELVSQQAGAKTGSPEN